MATRPGPVTVDTTQLAKLLNMTPRHVRRLKAEGVFENARDEYGNEIMGRYEMVKNVHAYIAYLKRAARLDDNSETTRQAYNVRRAGAEAELAEIRVKQVKGELHRQDDIEFHQTNMITHFKSQMQAIPSRVTRLVVGQTDYQTIYELLSNEIDTVLLNLSKYDASEFDKASEAFLASQGASLQDLNGAAGPNGEETTTGGADQETD
jgi:phage terminase Nu1 subunit (DNA packaging protein)